MSQTPSPHLLKAFNEINSKTTQFSIAIKTLKINFPAVTPAPVRLVLLPLSHHSSISVCISTVRLFLQQI